MTDAEFLERMKLLREDHEPDGYPCVTMGDIDRLLGIIDGLKNCILGLHSDIGIAHDCAHERMEQSGIEYKAVKV